jgi:c-di-GMP-binding flagellar brake protein YcgR
MRDFYCFVRSCKGGKMPFTEKRKYERRPYVKHLRFHLAASDIDKPKRDDVEYEGMSFDISDGGIGMITSHPLNEGDILLFKDEIKVDTLVATSGVVRWVLRLADTTYRSGLEFSDVRSQS